MGFLNRVMTAFRAGVSAYREESMLPIEELGWDTYQARVIRYYNADRYYNNIAYKNILELASHAYRRKIDSNLYKFIRGIYNPVYRLVEMYVAKVYGGALDFQDLSGGAIPITMADKTLQNAIRQLWLWSNWRSQKSLYVRYGSKFGDVALKIVDELDKEKVRIEVLHPSTIREAEFDGVGNVIRAVIEYQCTEPAAAPLRPGAANIQAEKTYTYTEIIDKEQFQFFKDQKAWDYINNSAAGEFAAYANPYGFVPLVTVQHRDEGLRWGANAYQTSLDKIDEINDSASLLNDQIRKVINPAWYFAGVQKADQISSSSDSRDKIPALYGPADSQPHPLVADINIADAGANIDRLLGELERDMPELALYRLRDANRQISGVAVRSMFGDAVDKFIEAQGNYDDGLIRAQQMAVSIGGFRKYAGFQSYTLDSYDRGDLTHYIETRPVFEDQLTIQERLGFLVQTGAPAKGIWQELQIPEETIDAWEKEKQDNQDAMEARMQGDITRRANMPDAQDEEAPVADAQ